MNIDNLKKLIQKVEKAELNIEELNNLKADHKTNKDYNGGVCNARFYVTGRKDTSAPAIDEDIFLQAVNDTIKRAEELNKKDKQIIESMNLMITPGS